ncbi:hypothetical protein [Sulfitobacter sp. MF3-043]|uniref:hypothetical protein n=1 Tax=Sulfitobacter sediminivivens TaxID=3252902 RepID=UPI0036DC94A5
MSAVHTEQPARHLALRTHPKTKHPTTGKPAIDGAIVTLRNALADQVIRAVLGASAGFGQPAISTCKKNTHV